MRGSAPILTRYSTFWTCMRAVDISSVADGAWVGTGVWATRERGRRAKSKAQDCRMEFSSVPCGQEPSADSRRTVTRKPFIIRCFRAGASIWLTGRGSQVVDGGSRSADQASKRYQGPRSQKDHLIRRLFRHLHGFQSEADS